MKKKKTLPQIPSAESFVISVDIGCGTVSLGNAQHQGARPYQEDSFGFSAINGNGVTSKGLLAVLADGMGGLKNGKAVSSDTVSGLLNWFNSDNVFCRGGEDLKNVVSRINQHVCDVYYSDGKVSAGSTVVAAYVNNGILHWICVGDSRLYLKRDDKLYQINEDHDYLNQLLADVIDGTLYLNEAFADKRKDALVGCIGNRELECFDYSKQGFRLRDGDILVLCSDGVYNALSHSEFNMCITHDAMGSSQDIIDRIAAKGYPTQDNNTIILITYKEKV